MTDIEPIQVVMHCTSPGESTGAGFVRKSPNVAPNGLVNMIAIQNKAISFMAFM